LTVTDETGAACTVCTGESFDIQIDVANPCAVDVEVDATCPVTFYAFGGPSTGSAAEICYGTGVWVTIPAGATTDWYGAARSSLAPGIYQGSYTLGGGLGDVGYQVCLE